MEWKDLAEMLRTFGFPVLVAAGVCYAVYQGLRFIGLRIAVPLFERLVKHIDHLESSLDDQPGMLLSIDRTLRDMHAANSVPGKPNADPGHNNRLAALWLAVGACLLLFATSAIAIEPADNPAYAMVRIRSHGASATVIHTREGKSWILGCCHMFLSNGGAIDRAALAKTLKMDGPPQPHAPAKTASARVLAYDPAVDLSLMELDNGPFNFLPVAPPGHRPSSNVQSLGFDSMKWPMTIRGASLLSSQGALTFTREKPWHGRSGGALVDVDNRVLIGVVQGYEVTGPQRGMYASHAAIVAFLKRHWPDYPYPARIAQQPGPRLQLDDVMPRNFPRPPGC